MSDQDDLVAIIRGLHEKLRLDVQKAGPEAYDSVWDRHVADADSRLKYSKCMHQLATRVWSDKHQGDPRADRIAWIITQIERYFFEGGFERVIKRWYRHQGLELDDSCLSDNITKSNSICVLDVGSCYNPLGRAIGLDPRFRVVSTDLTPATEDVIECDFLRLEIGPPAPFYPLLLPPLIKLPESSFHVVVFSLLLEYLPCMEWRLNFCWKASKLLSLDGLLLVITPDSKHALKNSHMIKSWREALLLLGLDRIVYEKLEHLHCMVFRKVCEPPGDWSKCRDLVDLMFIPQDSRDYVALEEEALQGEHKEEDRSELEDQLVSEIFEELPLKFKVLLFFLQLALVANVYKCLICECSHHICLLT